MNSAQLPKSNRRLKFATVFRELTTGQELADLFGLRHQVYSIQGYWDRASRRFDIDAYDRNSRFVGAYHRNRFGVPILVGGARLILSNQEPSSKVIDEIVEAYQLEDPGRRSHDYPVESIVPLADFNGLTNDGRANTAEFGRTVVHTEWQKSGFGVRLVHALYGLAMAAGIRRGVASVPPRLLPFYIRCGCRSVGQSSGRLWGIDTDLVPVLVDLTDLPLGAQEAYEAYHAFRHGGNWTIWATETPMVQSSKPLVG